MLKQFYDGKRVFVTGHTGFKGAWLCHWLKMLGAKVSGYALEPPTKPSLFEQLGLANRMEHQLADVRDAGIINRTVCETRPDFVFHLAAQSLVRTSYAKPLETYETNVMGTANLLEALRGADWPCAVVIVTSDKCYQNREWHYAYREEDALGGHDPYSSSKAAAELVAAGYRSSFFCKHPVRVATARAGNVIGGGDWAVDRIVPDCIRALQQNEVIKVRNPRATRPWQHVLEPLGAYLWLGAQLANPASESAGLATGFNFGPGLEANRPVSELVETILKVWPGRWQDTSAVGALHEAQKLHLAIDKANALLNWFPAWEFPVAVARTVGWYKSFLQGTTAADQLCSEEILAYTKRASERRIRWAAEN